MAFTGNHDHITSGGFFNRIKNSFFPISHFNAIRHFCHNSRTNLGWVFTARIIISDNHCIGFLRRNRPHQWAFAHIAITARTKHNGEMLVRIGPERIKHIIKRFYLVGIINEDKGTGSICANIFKPTCFAF